MLVGITCGDFFDAWHVPGHEAAGGIKAFVIELFLRDAGEPLVSHDWIFTALHLSPHFSK